MHSYDEQNVKTGPRIQKKTVATPLPAVLPPDKARVRERIQEEAGDTDAMVGKLADMVSLIISAMSEMWRVTTPACKEKMDPVKVALVQYMFDRFAVTETSADVDFKIDAYATINKLVDVQGTVGTIMKEEKEV